MGDCPFSGEGGCDLLSATLAMQAVVTTRPSAVRLVQEILAACSEKVPAEEAAQILAMWPVDETAEVSNEVVDD